MATTPRAGFKPSELADLDEAEALETQEQPAQQPAEAPAPQPPQPAPTEKKEAEPAQPYGPEDVVHYGRFKEVLDQKTALEKELADAREFRARLDERQRLLREQDDQRRVAEEQQRRAAQRPDPNLDPVGAEIYDLRQTNAQYTANLQAMQNQLNGLGQNVQSTQEQNTFAEWVKTHANNYAATPDGSNYFPAAKHAADYRIGLWKRIAPRAPAGLAEQMVEGESILIARLNQMYGDGNFPVEIARLAKDFGYNPNPAPAANGAPRPVARPPTQQQQRLQQVSNGQRMQGLNQVPAGGNANGASAYRNYSAADIANMSEREFQRALADPNTAKDLRYAMARAEGFDENEEVDW